MDSDILVARIVIERVLTEDGQDVVRHRATRGDDDTELPVIEVLGMLALAEDSVLHAPDDEEDAP